jgi:hypothetical protein
VIRPALATVISHPPSESSSGVATAHPTLALPMSSVPLNGAIRAALSVLVCLSQTTRERAGSSGKRIRSDS